MNTVTQARPVLARQLRAAIMRQRENILDCTQVVADRRDELDAAILALQVAVVERTRAERHFDHLLAWSADEAQHGDQVC